MKPKIAVLPPMPRASVRTAATVNAGRAASARRACRTSIANLSIATSRAMPPAPA